MPWIPLAVMAVGAATQVAGSLAGQKAQKEGMQVQSRMEALKAHREMVNQVRQSRAARAEIQQKGANQNANGSSVVTGASGVNMEAAGNIQYTGYEASAGTAMSKYKQKELDAQGVSSIGGGISDIAGTVFNNRKELFGSGAPNDKDSIF